MKFTVGVKHNSVLFFYLLRLMEKFRLISAFKTLSSPSGGRSLSLGRPTWSYPREGTSAEQISCRWGSCWATSNCSRRGAQPPVTLQKHGLCGVLVLSEISDRGLVCWTGELPEFTVISGNLSALKYLAHSKQTMRRKISAIKRQQEPSGSGYSWYTHTIQALKSIWFWKQLQQWMDGI